MMLLTVGAVEVGGAWSVKTGPGPSRVMVLFGPPFRSFCLNASSLVPGQKMSTCHPFTRLPVSSATNTWSP